MVLRGRALLGVGLVLFGLGAAVFVGRVRFVERSTTVQGTIDWVTRRHLGVTPDGERWSVSIRRPPFHLYRSGERVRVRIDRAAAIPGRIRAAGRIDSFLGLWLLPSALTLAGALLAVAATVAPSLATVELRRR